MTDRTASFSAFNRPLRVQLIIWTGLLLTLVVVSLTTLMARNATRLLEEQTSAQLTQLAAQSARAVSDFIEARERTVDLWASESLLLSVVRDPGLRAVFMSGLSGYISSYANREPWISDVLLIEDDVPIFALSGERLILKDPIAFVTLTDPGSPDQQVVNVKGSDTPWLAIRRQAVDRGTVLDNVFIILLIDAHLMQEELLSGTSPSPSGFIALQSAAGQFLTLPPIELGKLPRPTQRVETIPSDKYLIQRHRVENSPLHLLGVAALQDIQAPVRNMVFVAVMLGVSAIALGLGGTLYFTGRVTAPIRQLTSTARAMADVKFRRTSAAESQRMMHQPGIGTDEVGELTAVFELLDRTTEELTETNGLLETRNKDLDAARKTLATNLERLEREMDAARILQLSMVAPDRAVQELGSGVRSIGLMEPAREVGGDFYDCFALPDGNVVFFIGDVSDKGTASALLMSRTVSLVRFAAQQLAATTDQLPSAAEILTQVNDELCKNNSTRMFVTLFIGILEPSTGRLTFANAGHISPVHTSGGVAETLCAAMPDLPLGVKARSTYTTLDATLSRGDRLVMYTDGVTEAENPSHDFFGQDRLLDVVLKNRNSDMPNLVEAIRSTLADFVDGAEQFDDITMLVLGWEPMD